MNALRGLEIGAGALLSLSAFADLFNSVVLPRPAINKFVLGRRLFTALWSGWRLVGDRLSQERREGWLGTFGPIAVLVMFGVWALAFVLGYGLIIDGLRDEMEPVPADLWESLYFSATTLVPLSYGDFVPTGLAARLVTIGESATGVGVAAMVITLLFSLYASFQRREESVVALDAMAGAPPSGVQILETAAELGMRDKLGATFEEWRGWAAAVLESHLAYPVLFYFRSSHDNEAAWREFSKIRSKYASAVNQMAGRFAIIPAQWIGDRSYLPHRSGRGSR